MSDSVRPHRQQPTRLPRPWDSPGKNTGVGCHFLLQCMKVKRESEVISRVQFLATPWTAAYQAPPPMEFSRQECWSRVPFPSPGDVLDPGIEPWSSALQGDTLPSEPPGKPKNTGVVAYSFPRGFSRPRDRTWVSCTAGGFFTI